MFNFLRAGEDITCYWFTMLKNKLLITVSIFLICCGSVYSQSISNTQNLLKKSHSDPWIAMDKLKHFTSSFYFTTTSYYFMSREFDISNDQAKMNSICFTMSLGLGKEIFDSGKPGGFFSIKDLCADFCGAFVGIIVIRKISRAN